MTADAELWRAYRRSRDPHLRERLIQEHLSLVKYAATWIAGRLPSHLRLDDLFSAGTIGFLGALEDYDPERGVEFRAYALPRIRGAIFDELRRLDCVPRRVRRRLRDIERAVDVLSQRLDRPPTEEEIAAELRMDIAEYHRVLGDGVTLLSLDAGSAGLHGEGAPLETLENPGSPNPLLALETKERRALLARAIDRLPERERQVLALYYYEGLTMQEAGRVLGITESRVSQIHSSAIIRLRVALRRCRLQPSDFGVAADAARPAAGRPARGGAR